jgi:hypothetical protein
MQKDAAHSFRIRHCLKPFDLRRSLRALIPPLAINHRNSFAFEKKGRMAMS